MKLFAKRRPLQPTGALDENKGTKTNNEKQQDENVVSYFASNVESNDNCNNSKKKKEQLSIDELKQKDPKDLNSKQRRLLKRLMERTGGSENSNECDKNIQQKSKGTNEFPKVESSGLHHDKEKVFVNHDTDENDVILEKSEDEKEACAKLKKDGINTNVQNLRESDGNAVECADSVALKLQERDTEHLLQNLNSKERRKLKRQLEREQQEAKREDTGEKTVNNLEQCSKEKSLLNESPLSEMPRKKKRTVKDLSHLPKEERERREKQREMQKLAAERRAMNTNQNSKHAHPLNSERRRANRRKPGKSLKMAIMRKEAKERKIGLGQYNAYGYNMRKIKNI